MSARFFADMALITGQTVSLPEHTARHVQVLRLQPGDSITLFNNPPGGVGEGEFEATVTRMGRSDVEVLVGSYTATAREAARAVHLVVGMPANERMDWLVEKATELGVASIQPLATAHGVLRLSGERAEKKRAHWEAIAVASCEQCGRNRVPVVHPVQSFAGWIDAQPAESTTAVRLVLSLADGTRAMHAVQMPDRHGALVLSGPEGGLSSAEEQQAIARGFAPVSLGARVLRAETAALAALVSLAGL